MVEFLFQERLFKFLNSNILVSRALSLLISFQIKGTNINMCFFNIYYFAKHYNNNLKNIISFCKK